MLDEIFEIVFKRFTSLFLLIQVTKVEPIETCAIENTSTNMDLKIIKRLKIVENLVEMNFSISNNKKVSQFISSKPKKTVYLTII